MKVLKCNNSSHLIIVYNNTSLIICLNILSLINHFVSNIALSLDAIENDRRPSSLLENWAKLA